jgi:hypothetical protein
MNKHTSFHLWHYLLLIFILGLGTVGMFFYSGMPHKQYLLVIFVSTLYFLWGIFHHYLEGDLHIRIVVEYLLIALLAVVLLRGAIFRNFL